ncbi:hypothetical protein L9F63_006366 [Diploptera punctata]|uniref:Uncharacterized protein n=1 Tax=Diploptera punctata TaxID=6984 RepID=A0AAD7ZAT4_DIPPU|nr:hypothetical protein L9F63_006366 [Diploptera punctata]
MYFLASFVFYRTTIAIPPKRYDSIVDKNVPLILTKHGQKRPVTKLPNQDIYNFGNGDRLNIMESQTQVNNKDNEGTKQEEIKSDIRIHENFQEDKPVKIIYKGYSLFISTRDYVTNLINKIKNITSNFQKYDKEENNSDKLHTNNSTYVPYCQRGNLNTKFECLKNKLLGIVQEITLRESLKLTDGISLDRHNGTNIR